MYISMFATMHFSFCVVFSRCITAWDTYIYQYILISYFCVLQFFIVFIWISAIVSNDMIMIYSISRYSESHYNDKMVVRPSGGWINIKMTSYQYRKSHCGDKTILRPSYLHNGISYTGKTTSLYWIRALIIMVGINMLVRQHLCIGTVPDGFVVLCFIVVHDCSGFVSSW